MSLLSPLGFKGYDGVGTEIWGLLGNPNPHLFTQRTGQDRAEGGVSLKLDQSNISSIKEKSL